jgi:hypothetical protein
MSRKVHLHRGPWRQSTLHDSRDGGRLLYQQRVQSTSREPIGNYSKEIGCSKDTENG